MIAMFRFAPALLLLCVQCSILFAQNSAQIPQSTSQSRDTSTVTLSPVIVTPTEAVERQTPATFSNLNAKTINERYSVQDVPVLLSELPSITFHSENGN